MKKYGHCFECKRLLPIECLEQVEYYEDHLTKGAFHHKLLCKSCISKADEVFEEFYNGVPVSEIKVGGTN